MFKYSPCLYSSFVLYGRMQCAPAGYPDGFQLHLADPLGQVLCNLTHTLTGVGPSNGLQ